MHLPHAIAGWLAVSFDHRRKGCGRRSKATCVRRALNFLKVRFAVGARSLPSAPGGKPALAGSGAHFSAPPATAGTPQQMCSYDQPGARLRSLSLPRQQNALLKKGQIT